MLENEFLAERDAKVSPLADFGQSVRRTANMEADSPLSSLDASASYSALGAELVFTQTASLQYQSFYWQGAVELGLNLTAVVGSFAPQTFAPLSPDAYRERSTASLNAAFLKPVAGYFTI
ncbi:MAG: hypothetical protein HC890_06330, partial [Chloroflexaceae bacterium]|nr:hypothetical protein [Chloroflexaceae bacterium]